LEESPMNLSMYWWHPQCICPCIGDISNESIPCIGDISNESVPCIGGIPMMHCIANGGSTAFVLNNTIPLSMELTTRDRWLNTFQYISTVSDI
jgi:hypothetical protein